MTDIYRRYVLLHESLVPYLADLAAGGPRHRPHPGAAAGVPLARRARGRGRWDEWMLGDDLLVAPVWRSGARAREVWFPPGRWVDVFDRDTVIEGPVTRRVQAPLDVLPLYAAEGSDVLDLDRGGPMTADMTGKTVLITGGNAGLGLETAVALAACGADVTITSRNAERGDEARKEIVDRAGVDAGQVEVMALDLASTASIRAFAAAFLETHPRLDVLVNNAGLILSERRRPRTASRRPSASTTSATSC